MKRSVGIALAIALAAASACRSPGPSAAEPACSDRLALSEQDLRGGSLPAKTIALTFDDGPGARTPELSAYLRGEGIRAAFFVNGKNVTDARQLDALVKDGHVVANHTQTHRSITGRSTNGARLSDAELIDEIAQTDAIIAPFVDGRFMFRAPFGDFDAKAYAAVQPSPMNKYVGPIGWDVGDHMGAGQAADWDCWTPGADGQIVPPQACAQLYLEEIESAGRGIVLMHDPYFIDDDPAKGGTVDLVKILVPALVAKGYAFARLDEVPDIAALLPAPSALSDAGTSEPREDAEVGPRAPSPGEPDASGDKPEPCPPSPQAKASNAGESGNLRGR